MTAIAGAPGDDEATAIARSVADLDHSYLAVQGPPGTGKTYVGSHVIARLVAERGFRVGVVAQSHATIEHMLDGSSRRASRHPGSARRRKDPGAEHAFTVLPKNGVAAFTAENAAHGFRRRRHAAWDFSHEARIPRGSLDLLVIDEAGQFSLASTIAVSLAATRLLLLGDPQQLPQVSQGTHPEPVDTSASADLDHRRGRGRSRRSGGTSSLEPAACTPRSPRRFVAAVVRGPPRGASVTALRHLDGIARECTCVRCPIAATPRVRGGGADEVVRIVADLVGRRWTGGRGRGRRHPRSSSHRARCVPTTSSSSPRTTRSRSPSRKHWQRPGSPTSPSARSIGSRGRRRSSRSSPMAASSGRDAPRGLVRVPVAAQSHQRRRLPRDILRPTSSRRPPARRSAAQARGRRPPQRLRASGGRERLTRAATPGVRTACPLARRVRTASRLGAFGLHAGSPGNRTASPGSSSVRGSHPGRRVFGAHSRPPPRG